MSTTNLSFLQEIARASCLDNVGTMAGQVRMSIKKGKKKIQETDMGGLMVNTMQVSKCNFSVCFKDKQHKA